MYYTALNLTQEPFSTSPDPYFLYHSDQHKTVLNRLEITIRLKRGLSLVLGDIGTGKTTLSRAIIQKFIGEEDVFNFFFVLNPTFSTEHDFLRYLSARFGVTPYIDSVFEQRQAIESFLYQQCVEKGKTIILVVDEGQKLSAASLELLRSLLNYETNEFKMLQVVIFAQMELLPKLKELQNFVDRACLKYVMRPLNLDETKELIRFRLSQAGYFSTHHLFTPQAVDLIYRFSRGYPRKITLICHKALTYLLKEDVIEIDEHLMQTIISQEQHWS